MNAKVWTTAEIRTLARQFVTGHEQKLAARGAYFRALIETAQAELGGKAGLDGQLAAVRAVHHKFYPVIRESIATDEILLATGIPRKDVALERNRRLNFARSSYGTIKRWLRTEGHDLMKLDSKKVSKPQLEKDAPAPRKHALTPKRINARAKKHLSELLAFTREIAKTDQEQAAAVLIEAMHQLGKQLAGGTRATTDAKVSAQEQRPLHLAGRVFWPLKKAA